MTPILDLKADAPSSLLDLHSVYPDPRKLAMRKNIPGIVPNLHSRYQRFTCTPATRFSLRAGESFPYANASDSFVNSGTPAAIHTAVRCEPNWHRPTNENTLVATVLAVFAWAGPGCNAACNAETPHEQQEGRQSCGRGRCASSIQWREPPANEVQYLRSKRVNDENETQVKKTHQKTLLRSFSRSSRNEPPVPCLHFLA